MVRRPILRRFSRLTPHALALAALLALHALTACGGEYVAGPDGEWASSTGGAGHGADSTGTSSQSAQLLGRWWRIVRFTSDGSARTSETYWDFHADGTVERRLVTSNLTHGLSDVLVWTGRWRAVGGEIEITYVVPAQGTVRFRWRVERGVDTDVLFLDDALFQRLP